MNNNLSVYDDILSVLEKKNILIAGHLAPDADCISSILALFMAFDGRHKGWQLVLEDDYPPNVAFLPGIDQIKKPAQISGQVDMVLLLDCSDYQRASSGWLDHYKDRPLYIIDHHFAEMDKGTITLREVEATATAQIIFKLIKAAGRPINSDIAMLLYSGIVSDSGGFRFSNTTPEVLLVAAELLLYGVDLETVRVNLFERRTFANMKILGAALESLQLFYGGAVSLMAIDRASMSRYNAKATDCINIVNFSLLVENVKIGVLLEEREEGIKVSLRCRDNYFINDIAAAFGGGGHARAAGCTLSCSLAAAKSLILQAIAKKIGEAY